VTDSYAITQLSTTPIKPTISEDSVNTFSK